MLSRLEHMSHLVRDELGGRGSLREHDVLALRRGERWPVRARGDPCVCAHAGEILVKRLLHLLLVRQRAFRRGRSLRLGVRA